MSPRRYAASGPPDANDVHLVDRIASGHSTLCNLHRDAHAGGMTSYDDYLRWLYRDGPNLFARVQNRVSAVAFSAGIWPRRVATLEVRGRLTAG